MITPVVTFWRVNVTSLITSMSAMFLLVGIMLILKAIKCHLKGSFDKQYITSVVNSYEIYEIRRRLVSLISYEMTTHARSSIFKTI